MKSMKDRFLMIYFKAKDYMYIIMINRELARWKIIQWRMEKRNDAWLWSIIIS